MPFGLSEPRWRFFRTTLIISIVGLAAFIGGEFWGGPLLFDTGLAVTILGLTMMSQILFHLYWVENKA